jgi:phosphatidylserine/phosphatidylglycerophosphate/cardiolipin synthase-like enzyme
MLHHRLPRAAIAVAAAGLIASAGIGLTAGASQAATRSAQATYALKTLPGQGATWFYNQVNAAKSSIDLVMYELQDSTADTDLGNAASRGVDVRVILDQREQSSNQTAYNYLTSHGVHVVWSWSKYYYTHEKSMVVDNSYVDIMTLNLQSQYYSTTRDFAVVDRNAKDVTAAAKTFNADYAHSAITPPVGADLVWSPTNAQAKLTGLINNANSSLKIYSEEMDDPTVTSDLVNAANRGVKVQVVGENESGEYDSEYTQLHNAGVQISYYSNPSGFYIHGKVIMADYGTSAAKIFIGSENFSNTSLTENRELGLIINNSAIESSVNTSFTKDYNGGTKFS